MRARQESVEVTRDRILEAAFDLWRELAYDDVTVDMVATAAGVSRQTVHRQFGSKDDLALAVTAYVGPRIEQDAMATAPGDVRAALNRQMELYEHMGDLNVRMVQMEGRVAAFDQALERGRAGHRAWIEHVFGPHLPARGKSRELAIMSLYAATDVMVWKLIRRDFGASRAETEAVMLRLIEGVLAPGTQSE